MRSSANRRARRPASARRAPARARGSDRGSSRRRRRRDRPRGAPARPQATAPRPSPPSGLPRTQRAARARTAHSRLPCSRARGDLTAWGAPFRTAAPGLRAATTIVPQDRPTRTSEGPHSRLPLLPRPGPAPTNTFTGVGGPLDAFLLRVRARAREGKWGCRQWRAPRKRVHEDDGIGRGGGEHRHATSEVARNPR